jgi:hypothetical protein
MNSNPDAAAKERTSWWSKKEWKLRQRHRGGRIAWSTELGKSVFRKDVSTLSQNFDAGQQISATDLMPPAPHATNMTIVIK